MSDNTSEARDNVRKFTDVTRPSVANDVAAGGEASAEDAVTGKAADDDVSGKTADDDVTKRKVTMSGIPELLMEEDVLLAVLESNKNGGGKVDNLEFDEELPGMAVVTFSDKEGILGCSWHCCILQGVLSVSSITLQGS